MKTSKTQIWSHTEGAFNLSTAASGHQFEKPDTQVCQCIFCFLERVVSEPA